MPNYTVISWTNQESENDYYSEGQSGSEFGFIEQPKLYIIPLSDNIGSTYGNQYVVSASDFSISGGTPINGQYYNGEGGVTLPEEVLYVTMTDTATPGTPDNIIEVCVFLDPSFTMPAGDYTIDIDIDGDAQVYQNVFNAYEYGVILTNGIWPGGNDQTATSSPIANDGTPVLDDSGVFYLANYNIESAKSWNTYEAARKQNPFAIPNCIIQQVNSPIQSPAGEETDSNDIGYSWMSDTEDIPCSWKFIVKPINANYKISSDDFSIMTSEAMLRVEQSGSSTSATNDDGNPCGVGFAYYVNYGVYQFSDGSSTGSLNQQTGAISNIPYLQSRVAGNYQNNIDGYDASLVTTLENLQLGDSISSIANVAPLFNQKSGGVIRRTDQWDFDIGSNNHPADIERTMSFSLVSFINSNLGPYYGEVSDKPITNAQDGIFPIPPEPGGSATTTQPSPSGPWYDSNWTTASEALNGNYNDQWPGFSGYILQNEVNSFFGSMAVDGTVSGCETTWTDGPVKYFSKPYVWRLVGSPSLNNPDIVNGSTIYPDQNIESQLPNVTENPFHPFFVNNPPEFLVKPVWSGNVEEANSRFLNLSTQNPGCDGDNPMVRSVFMRDTNPGENNNNIEITILPCPNFEIHSGSPSYYILQLNGKATLAGQGTMNIPEPEFDLDIISDENNSGTITVTDPE